MTKNKVWKLIISLAAAFCLWLYVVTVVSPGSEETFYDVEVRIMDAAALKENGLILTEYQKTVTVRLEGKRTDLVQLKNDGFTVSAYVAGCNTEDHDIEYSADLPDSVLGNAITVQKKEPEKLKIKVEKLVTKSVPVALMEDGQRAPGYSPGYNLEQEVDKICDYTHVDVRGPESWVNKIEYAVVKLDMENASQSVSGDFEYTLCDVNKKPVELKNPDLLEKITSETIHVELPMYKEKTVTLGVEVKPAGGINENNLEFEFVEFQTIDVLCSSDSAEKLEQMDDVLYVYQVDMAQLMNDTELKVNLTAKLDELDLRRNDNGAAEVTLKLKLKDVDTKKISIPASQIKISNANYKITTDTPVEVTVRGSKELIDQITAKDITVSLKVQENAVSDPFPPEIKLNEKFKDLVIISSTPDNYRVTLIKQDAADS